MPVTPIPTPSQPWTGGPYSGAMRAGDWVVLAGQIGVDPTTGEVAPGGVLQQFDQALRNAAAALGDAGATWADVAKVTIFLAADDPGMMPALNALYAEHLGEQRPARTTVGVAWLPLRTLVELEVWAYHPEAR
ncbi:MAG TPA: Rid family hydrolase [Acidimicrobiia bacterium]|jgi:2-iminobutanoate/2-iminopropanoate deaminase|nr:Rid family hydrolase [Acidimicrobiia bacterium]